MDAVRFVKEFNRMCRKTLCGECDGFDFCDIKAADFDKNDAENLVDVVQKWSEENPYLKPCPFCGATSSVRVAKSPLWHVVCCGCGGRTGYWDDKEKAVEVWNRRTE